MSCSSAAGASATDLFNMRRPVFHECAPSKDNARGSHGLVLDGFLELQNQRRWASYRLPGGSPHSRTDSPHNGADSLHSAANSPQKGAELAPGLAPLAEIAAPARARRRLPSEEMKMIIENLCRVQWLSASEIAALTDREAENLQSRFLTAMVREGRLRLRFPDVPNRPDQAYRAVDAPK